MYEIFSILLLLLLIDSNIKKKFWYKINMSNPQKNEIEQIKRDKNLLEDRLQKSKIQNEIEIIRKEINLLQDRLTEKEIQNKMEQIR